MNTEKQDIILEARNISYAYEKGEPYSLNGVSLQIRRGSKVAFMGANGCGKSTFFLCCNGIFKPDKGELLFAGRSLDYSRKGLLHLRSKVGVVFQEPDNQLFCSSVFQEISFGILNMGVPPDRAKQEVEGMIESLEISPFQDRPTHALSGGQKKQVSIADILVMRPDVMILDEPGAALDARHTKIVHEIVDRLTQEGITVLMATHDMNYALLWADEIVLMHEGQVLMQDSPINVCAHKAVLAMTNQAEPEVLRLFSLLQKKGIIGSGLTPPRDMAQLEGYIEAFDK